MLTLLPFLSASYNFRQWWRVCRLLYCTQVFTFSTFMKTPTLNACLRKKRLYINRTTIEQLGNPSHLGFWYDEKESLLYVSATSPDNLDAFEIPKNFWKSSGSFEVARMPFLMVLQYRLKWEKDSKYSYAGTSTCIRTPTDRIPAFVFKMTEGTKLR